MPGDDQLEPQRVRAEVHCGEDFCDNCGDCLECYGDDPCYGGGTTPGGHTWPMIDNPDLTPGQAQ